MKKLIENLCMVCKTALPKPKDDKPVQCIVCKATYV